MIESLEALADLIQKELLDPDLHIGPGGLEWLGKWTEEHRICAKDVKAALHILMECHLRDGVPPGSLRVVSASPEDSQVPLSDMYLTLKVSGALQCISGED